MGIILILGWIIYYFYQEIKASMDEIDSREYAKSIGSTIYTDRYGSLCDTKTGRQCSITRTKNGCEIRVRRGNEFAYDRTEPFTH